MAGVVDDGVSVVLDGAGEVVLVPHLHGLAHRRSQPRHFPKRLGKSPTDWKFSKKKIEEDEECDEVRERERDRDQVWKVFWEGLEGEIGKCEIVFGRFGMIEGKRSASESSGIGEFGC